MEKKYIVKVPNVFTNSIEIDAINEEEAKQKVKALLTATDSEQNYPLNYELTLSEEHWGVFNKEDLEKLKENN